MLVTRLAMADMRHDRTVFVCAALTIASVVAPMLLLLGLKTGVVDHLTRTLLNSPSTLELIMNGHGAFPKSWFDQLRARPDVAFVIPRLRAAAQPMDVSLPSAPLRGYDADFWISAPGDPLLGELSKGIDDSHVVLSARLAERTTLKPGDAVIVWATRDTAAGRRRRDVPMTVASIAPPLASQGLVVFGPLSAGIRLEGFQEREDAEVAADTYLYPSFRMYARELTDVAPLADMLFAQGVEVNTDVARIEWTLQMDRSLTALFGILVASAGGGIAVTLAASLWGNVARKRRALSVLRLMGLRAGRLWVFPIVQGLLVAVAGTGFGTAAALGIAVAINSAYRQSVSAGGPLCHIRADQVLVAFAAVSGVALLAGIAAVRPVLRIEPVTGLREV